MRFTLFFLLFLLHLQLRSQLQLPCAVGKDRYICSDNLILETKSSLPGKWHFFGGSSGVFSDPTSKTTTLSNISLPIIKVYWANNDQSCADTLEIVQPKIGSTSLLKNGSPLAGNQTQLCYGDDWKASTSISQGKSFVAYILYNAQPPSNPDIFKDNEAFPGPVVFVNNDLNDGSLISKYPNSSKEYWFVPILYNEIGVSGPIIDSICQITGTPFKIKYLDKIKIDKNEDCMLGSSQLTIVGGTSNYDIKSVNPTSLSIDSSQLLNGEIKLSNILVKQWYYVDIKDDNGCVLNYNSKFSPCPACKTDVLYQKTYCITDSFPTPALKEGAGIGRLELFPYTETGLIFDSLTGGINIQASKPGNYIIRNYTSAVCSKQGYTDFNIELLDTIPIPTGNNIDTLCMPNPKVGDIKSISAQLITWYNKNGEKLDPAIDPAIHGVTYFCTQTIKGCESDKKAVKIFAPTVNAPQGDSIQYLCNKNYDLASKVLKPFESNVKWYDSNNQLINQNQKISEGYYYATQNLGCESHTRLKAKVQKTSVSIPSLFSDTLKYCITENHFVRDLVPNTKGSKWYDLPNSTSVLNDYSVLEQGTYYYEYQDTLTNCLTERRKVWIWLPEFNLDVSQSIPYCGFNNGGISVINSNNNYLFELNTSKVDTIIKNLKSGDYHLKIYTKIIPTCSVDTLIHLDCKESRFQEIITPNNDGKNDLFVLGLYENYPFSKLTIYNRWGNNVYESKIPYKDNWNGTDYSGNPLPTGTYYYTIDSESNEIILGGFIELVQ